VEETRTEYGEKKYFWLKLRNNFFDTQDMKVVLKAVNGEKYAVFWLKLLCTAITEKEVGILRYKENIPYNEKLLSDVTDTDIDVVRSAMTLFISLGMVTVSKNGDLWIDAAVEMVGSEQGSAQRVRRHRAKKKELENEEKPQIEDNRYNVPKCNLELEKELELEKNNAPSAQKPSVSYNAFVHGLPEKQREDFLNATKEKQNQVYNAFLEGEKSF